MNYDLVIFDLDGTLLDTLDDLAAAANHALAVRGFPTRSREDIRRFIGNGVARLIRRALPEGASEEICREALSDFRDYYARNLNVHTAPCDGIMDLLRALRRAGVRAAVNSNKPDEATRALCRAHFPGLIDIALGERADTPRKPAPDGANRIIETLGVSKLRALYVGDGDADLLTAQNAGIDAAWVSWGYRTLDELSGIPIPRAFDSAQALEAYILGE